MRLCTQNSGVLPEHAFYSSLLLLGQPPRCLQASSCKPNRSYRHSKAALNRRVPYQMAAKSFMCVMKW